MNYFLKKISLRLLIVLLPCLLRAETSALELKSAEAFKTRNVVIVVADGERYTETWGDPKHENIPELSMIAAEGVVFTNCRNLGITLTVPAHAAMLTGCYDRDLDNKGESSASRPSIFQRWLKNAQAPTGSAWIITSKAKLSVLANTTDVEWTDHYMPSVDCLDRPDKDTIPMVLAILKRDHPRLLLVNFSNPDRAGHAGKYKNYLQAIRDVDGYMAQIWEFLKEDPFYARQTAFFLLNDHGRHTKMDSKSWGHGCNCDGCSHIMLFAAGPDFKKGIVAGEPVEQIDVPATVARLLNLKLPDSKGKVLKSVF